MYFIYTFEQITLSSHESYLSQRKYRTSPVKLKCQKGQHKSIHQNRSRRPLKTYNKKSGMKCQDQDHRWTGNHRWVPLLQQNYASEITLGCEQYAHYFDALLNILLDGAPSLTSCQHC